MSLVVAASVVGEMIAKGVAKKFGASVFERWTRYRAQRFLEGFCKELESEFQNKIVSDKVDEALDEILTNEKKSEALFDAYRAVSLAKSKKIGPRVIGLLTGKIVIESRDATFLEQDFFVIAEQLSDEELLGLASFIEECDRSLLEEKKHIKEANGSIEIQLHEENLDSSWKSKNSINLAPIDLREYFGSWALKIRNIGLFSERIDERNYDYQEDSERHIDEPGSVREIKWVLSFPSNLRELATLIERAIPD